MAFTPIPGSFLLSAKLSCLFMAPDGTLQPWDVVLDVANNQTPCNATASQKKREANKKRKLRRKLKLKLKKKSEMRKPIQISPWKSPCPEHIPDKVVSGQIRDNGEYWWRCAVCKVDL